jgi:hypothetical protein
VKLVGYALGGFA